MAKRKYFEIVRIAPPGRVDLVRRGEVRLHELSDEELYEIYREGSCKQFIKMTPEGFRHYYPSKKTINTSSTADKTGKNKQTSTNTAKSTTKKSTGKSGASK